MSEQMKKPGTRAGTSEERQLALVRGILDDHHDVIRRNERLVAVALKQGFLITYECAPAGTMIATPRGERPIESIVAGDEVWGFDGVSVVRTTVLATRKSASSEAFVRIGTLSLTGNHPVWTEERGYLEARDLASGHQVRVLEMPDASLADLRAIGPTNPVGEVRGRNVPSASATSRTHLESADGWQDAPRLLDPIALVDQPASYIDGPRDGHRRLVAGGREEVDCSSQGESGEPHHWRGGHPGLRPDTGTAGEVVEPTEGPQVRAGAYAPNAGEVTLGGSGRKDLDRGSWPDAFNGRSGEDLSRASREASFGGAHREDGGGEAGALTHPRAQGQDCGGDDWAEVGGLHRDWRALSINHGDRQGAGRERDISQSVDPEGVPLSREALAPRLAREVLDPPYEDHEGLYAEGSPMSAKVRDWAIEYGFRRDMRIALCGYEGEHSMPDGWTVHAWKAKGGYASQGDGSNENARRERIWFSPACLPLVEERQISLFGRVGS